MTAEPRLDPTPVRSQKICVVMPAYNAEKTLERTYRDLPLDWVDDVVLVDDASRDRTLELAHELGLHALGHRATAATAAIRRPAIARRSRGAPGSW